MNEERLRAQIVEADEQCERMDIPALHETVTLQDALAQAPIQRYAAMNASTRRRFRITKEDAAVFIGPPGGWSEKERDLLRGKCNAHVVGLPFCAARSRRLPPCYRRGGVNEAEDWLQPRRVALPLYESAISRGNGRQTAIAKAGTGGHDIGMFDFHDAYDFEVAEY